jgi:hypothetical protein
MHDAVSRLSQKHKVFIFREFSILLCRQTHVMASEFVVSSELMSSEFIDFASGVDQTSF